MQRIISFGDSFVFGTELFDNHDGSKAWPALAANALGVKYTTCAVPGCGNEAITRQILDYFCSHDKTNVLAVINWTWAQRWDFYLGQGNEKWFTLGPMCVPHRYYEVLDNEQSQRVVEFAKDYGCASLLWNKMRSLQTIYVAQEYLKRNSIPSVQTYMDYELLNQTTHAPSYIKELQNIIEPNLSSWKGKNFLDWSRDHDFTVTNPGLHPLEDAHQAAAELWRPTYARYLT